MFGSQSGARAYAKVGVETGVLAASPHSLVVMLFDGAMAAVASAMQHMQAGEIEAKGAAISKAIMIIDSGLRASLNKEAGGGLALNLDALYEYMSRRLLTANLKNQQSILEEVYQLLQGLKTSWEAIGSAPQGNAPAAAQPPRPAYDAAPVRTPSLVKA